MLFCILASGSTLWPVWILKSKNFPWISEVFYTFLVSNGMVITGVCFLFLIILSIKVVFYIGSNFYFKTAMQNPSDKAKENA